MTPQIEEAVETLLRMRREFNAVEEAARVAGGKYSELTNRRNELNDAIYKHERELRELIVEESLRD